MVRSLGMTQTFLDDAEIDQLVAQYRAGAPLAGLAKQFDIQRVTVSDHLARRDIPIRRGLDATQAKEAVPAELW